MTLCRTSKFRYWGQQIHDQAVQVLHYLLTIYSVLTAGTHKYVKDTIDAKNAKQMFRFGPAVKKKERRESGSVYSTWFGISCLCPSFPYVPLTTVLILRFTLSCVILIATYQLPNLEVEPVFSWINIEKKIITTIANLSLIAFFQILHMDSNQACINMCMLGGWECF